MKLGWSLVSNNGSNVELRSIKSDLSDVLEDFAVEYQVDIIPLVSKSLQILREIRELILRIRSNLENRDFEEAELARIVTTASQLHQCMDEYISSISPPKSVELCDARLSSISFCLQNLVLRTANTLTGSQHTWLQTSSEDISEKIKELREDLNYVDDPTSLV